jgi:hypothetical protein
VEQWPVGVVDGPLTGEALDEFLDGVHAEFAAADRGVRSVLVHRGPPAPDELTVRARQRAARVTNYVAYQGLLDLSPLVEWQTARLTNDGLYPPGLYVPQRYRCSARAMRRSGTTCSGSSRSGSTPTAPGW